MKPITKLCAIYTRKSTDERLDMEFNSLDAQRDACNSYILSQKSEGWVASKYKYDDGGFSGGTMDRPALKQLMADIAAGKIQIVVVYKIDRLTRSLMDFAKLVETFDAHGVTFVSVTQSFNTTTSMGRLTLNVLLSFAQFEREVAGERIRDKIAASKKRGIWMGGNPPLGYDIVKKHLVINESEAKTVKYIFERYLELDSVAELKNELAIKGIKSKVKVSEKRRKYGGITYSRGAIYSILQNPVYIGKVRHKQETYDGQHEPIIDIDLWNTVQRKLTDGAATVRGIRKSRDINLLQGILHDCEGTVYSPSHSNKGGKRYRYYISQNLLQYRDHPNGIIARLAAGEIEAAVAAALESKIKSAKEIAQLLDMNMEQYHEQLLYIVEHADILNPTDLVRVVVKKVIVDTNQITLEIDALELHKEIAKKLALSLPSYTGDRMAKITAPYGTYRSKKGAIIINAKTQDKQPFDLPPQELKKLVQGIVWRDEHFNGLTLQEIAKREKVSDSHVGKQIFKAFEILKAQAA